MFTGGRCGAVLSVPRQTLVNSARCPKYHKTTCERTYSTRLNSVVFSGIQPTGIPHLGNYLGALRPWVQLQNSAAPGTRLLFSVVDLHALTGRQNPAELRRWRRETYATLLAIGLDPKKSTIFFQSDVPAHTELMWILSCTASMGYLSRMTQWKSKLALPEQASPLDSTARSKLKLGLFSYPVLQAADILVHGATHVPVGEDQAQHLEFTRECATNFNTSYGKVLVEPETIVSPAKRIMSLKEPTLKMSKSYEDARSRILLTDTAQEIQKKVRQALTDSEPGISYDPIRRAGISNLLDILSHLKDDRLSPAQLAQEHGKLSLRAFKELVAEEISNHLAPIREAFAIQMSSSRTADLLYTAHGGGISARASADAVLSKVREAIGLL